MYLHYSFDVWDTLIRSNPNFSEARTDLFFRKYNPRRYDKLQVKDILSDVRTMCDNIDVLTGKNMSSVEVISIILWRLGIKDKDPIPVRDYLERLFLANPPVIYSDKTIEVLETLKSRGANLSILSNTSFTRGVCISMFLNKTPISGLMTFELYSDMWDMCKPSKAFYNKMYNIAYKNSPALVKKEQLCHVGDNKITDFNGAKDFGVHSLLINSNKKTIIDLL